MVSWKNKQSGLYRIISYFLVFFICGNNLSLATAGTLEISEREYTSSSSFKLELPKQKFGGHWWIVVNPKDTIHCEIIGAKYITKRENQPESEEKLGLADTRSNGFTKGFLLHVRPEGIGPLVESVKVSSIRLQCKGVNSTTQQIEYMTDNSDFLEVQTLQEDTNKTILYQMNYQDTVNLGTVNSGEWSESKTLGLSTGGSGMAPVVTLKSSSGKLSGEKYILLDNDHGTIEVSGVSKKGDELVVNQSSTIKILGKKAGTIETTATLTAHFP